MQERAEQLSDAELDSYLEEALLAAGGLGKARQPTLYTPPKQAEQEPPVGLDEAKEYLRTVGGWAGMQQGWQGSQQGWQPSTIMYLRTVGGWVGMQSCRPTYASSVTVSRERPSSRRLDSVPRRTLAQC